ncbi:MAG: alkaline phosphatase family protein [Chloroflexota bacterium]|nr:alkaline phosphatase family protein [Chloroflexota bacterium]
MNIAASLGRFLPGPSRRCLVVALDGIGHGELIKAVEAGAAPTLGHFIAEGELQAIASTHPPVSAIAWSSFMTACYSGKHGVFGFTNPQADYSIRFTDAGDLRMPTLWERAAIDGLRSVIVNLPGTYPARRMSGSLVSGFVAPDLALACHPRSLGTRLAAEGYVIDVDAARAHSDPAGFSVHLLDVLRRRIEAMESMLDSERWSLGILAFTEADRLNRMWFRRIGDGDGIERETYWRWFREVDSFVARCAARYSNADIVVVSVTGFGPLKRFVNLDKWLQANGYLDLGASGALSPDSMAFSMDAGRIYVASSDMFRSGAVPRDDVGRLVDDIAAGLAELVDPNTGRPVIATVRKRRDADGGASTPRPNLVCLPASGYELKSSRDRPLFSDAVFEGTHTQQDALLLATRTTARQGATVADAGATVLAKLGLYHDDADGKSLLS